MNKSQTFRFRILGPWNSEMMFQGVMFGLTFLSAVSFSLSSFLARLGAPQRLPALIQFQSTSVFLAFLLQSGLRAGLRNQFHLGRIRMVEEIEKNILRTLPFIAAPLSFLTLTLFQLEICPAFAFLHAALTLLMGLRISQSRIPLAAFWSILTFASIVIPCSLITWSTRPFVELRLPIEGFSLLALTALAWGKRPGLLAALATKKVLRSCFGIQLSDFALNFLNFMLGQYIVFLSHSDIRVGVAYADIQVLCGVQALLFSRLCLTIEGRLIREGKVFGLLKISFAWGILFSLGVFAVVTLRGNPLAPIYGALCLFNLGTLPYGLISQFIREKFRWEALAATLTAGIIIFIGIKLGIRGNASAVIITFFSPALLVGLIALRSQASPESFFRPS